MRSITEWFSELHEARRSTVDGPFLRRMEMKDEVAGYGYIARFMQYDERNLRRARAEDSFVHRVIQKRGGRYFANTHELLELKAYLFLRAIDPSNRPSQAATQPRSGGRFAKRKQPGG